MRARPPGGTLPSGLASFPGPVAWHCAALLAFAAPLAAPLTAQFVRGTVRQQGTAHAVPGMRITAVDSAGATLLDVESDGSGRFTLALTTGQPFKVIVRKIGLGQASSDLIRAALSDTLEIDLILPADATALPVVEVAGEKPKSPNQRLYDDAVRRGWKVYDPAKVADQREKYHDFPDLLRALQVPGIRIGRPSECIQSTRFMGRCLAYVIDGVPAGPMAMVIPTDVYFFAVLSASESSVIYGNKAPWGAIVIYTRMNGDNYKTTRRP